MSFDNTAIVPVLHFYECRLHASDTKTYKFGHTAVVPYGWEGNRGSDVAQTQVV